MSYLSILVPPALLKSLSRKEVNYLKKIFIRFNGLPDLNELWGLMDETWVELGCDPNKIDSRVKKFYKHPVWLVNGLFSDIDPQSVEFRKIFTRWIKTKAPKRVADFGGGFGTLASFIGKALPNTQIEIIDPHPNPAVKKYRSFKNVKFAKRFTGKYDLIIATDVFEHLSDPIIDLKKTGKYLHGGGYYLIANCFEPVIMCHLPQHFHLKATWDYIMKAMGYEITEKVAYGCAYRLIAKSNEILARQISKRGKKIDLFIKSFPIKKFGRLNNILNRLYHFICYSAFR
jgi:trans-aconitate methyltransferase